MNEHHTTASQYMIEVRMDAKTFREFAVFDVFIRLRRWIPLAVFAAILSFSALMCFILHSRAQSAVLLGVVLLVIGLGLPAIYVVQFFVSVKKQTKILKLDKTPHVYTLSLTSASLVVEINNKHDYYALDELYGVYYGKNAVYVYVKNTKAFILPANCIGFQEKSLKEFLSSRLSAGKLHDFTETRNI